MAKVNFGDWVEKLYPKSGFEKLKAENCAAVYRLLMVEFLT